MMIPPRTSARSSHGDAEPSMQATPSGKSTGAYREWTASEHGISRRRVASDGNARSPAFRMFSGSFSLTVSMRLRQDSNLRTRFRRPLPETRFQASLRAPTGHSALLTLAPMCWRARTGSSPPPGREQFDRPSRRRCVRALFSLGDVRRITPVRTARHIVSVASPRGRGVAHESPG